MLTHYLGVPIIGNPCMVVLEEQRVPGGYMNRWLIRRVVNVPSRQVIHDRRHNRLYCHPSLLTELQRAVAK